MHVCSLFFEVYRKVEYVDFFCTTHPHTVKRVSPHTCDATQRNIDFAKVHVFFCSCVGVCVLFVCLLSLASVYCSTQASRSESIAIAYCVAAFLDDDRHEILVVARDGHCLDKPPSMWQVSNH